MSELWSRFRPWATARHLAQLGVVLLLVWMVFIGTEMLTATGAKAVELAGVKSNIGAFGCLFAVVFHFFWRDRVSLVILAVAFVALAWFTLTANSDLPAWLGFNF